MEEARREGAVWEIRMRFFRWSLRDWEREIDAGYPWLGTQASHLKIVLREYLAGLPRDRALAFGHSLARRAHREALARLGENLEGDAENLARHRALTDAAMLRPYRERPKGIPPRELAKALKSHFGVRFGEPDPASRKGLDWRYLKRHGDWIVRTAFDASGRPQHLLYEHSIVHADGRKALERASLLSWLGISGQTGWDIEGVSDLPRLCGLLDEICGHFLAAAPAWLQGQP
jgi:hypothetical protein